MTQQLEIDAEISPNLRPDSDFLRFEFTHPDGPRMQILANRETAAALMANRLLDVLDSARDGDTILLATGNTMLSFYPELIRKAAERQINLARFNYGHIDNFVWRPEDYPNGPGEDDYVRYLRANFVGPAGIPEGRFHPINGFTHTPEKTAAAYNSWLEKQHVIAVLLGIGPEPVAHLAYMRSDADLEQGVSYLPISPETVARNVKRSQESGKAAPPDECITLGLRFLRRAEHKFVLASGSEYRRRIDVTFNGPVDPQVIATFLRTSGFRETVEVYLDVNAGWDLISEQENAAASQK